MSGFALSSRFPTLTQPIIAHTVKCVMQTVAEAVDEVVTVKATRTHTTVPINHRGIFHVG